MSNRVLCKFFAHGACLKGEHCEFSHDWKDEANNICTFYQKGACSYGSRCRYYHAKSSRQPTSTALSANLLLMNQTSNTTLMVKDSSPSVISSSNLFLPTQTWTQHKGGNSIIDSESEDENDYTSGRPADIPICAFAAAGNCPKGEKCPHLHGDVCPTCGKHCLHPFRLNERDEHIRQCQKNSKHLEALRKSQEIECSVCLDRVLAKPTPAERKFGLLSECDHPFCISCIRNWRGSSPASGMDVNNVLRACPICRKVSYYVIPSVIWYSTKEEKQEIVDSYKSKLSSIDCKHFDFGNGNCPFGNSCFYKHVYRDGRREEVVLRHLGSQDGNMVIAKDVRWSPLMNYVHFTKYGGSPINPK